MKNPVELFKWIRKKNHIQQSYSGKYAFVGIGNHSINNLYPVIDYLNVPLKYIVTKTTKTADLLNQNYPDVIATNDYQQVLDDNEINGVFICAHPNDHYRLAKEALLKNKNVFVEKPLCLTLNELNDIDSIAKKTGNICVAGLQKRYSICSKILRKRLTKESIYSYNYKFAVGGYPEGNILWDIFIHPVDLIYFLFGKYDVISFQKSEQGKGLCTILMQTRHSNKVIGSLEISTMYSWNFPKEELCINTQKGIYEMANHQQLIYAPKPSNIMSIPVDKVFSSVPTKEYLFDTNNFLPVFQNNQLVSQGYFNEIKTFLDLCEGKKSNNLSAPESLIHTYSVIENILK